MACSSCCIGRVDCRANLTLDTKHHPIQPPTDPSGYPAYTNLDKILHFNYVIEVISRTQCKSKRNPSDTFNYTCEQLASYGNTEMPWADQDIRSGFGGRGSQPWWNLLKWTGKLEVTFSNAIVLGDCDTPGLNKTNAENYEGSLSVLSTGEGGRVSPIGLGITAILRDRYSIGGDVEVPKFKKCSCGKGTTISAPEGSSTFTGVN